MTRITQPRLRNGFTLIELLALIANIAIVATMFLAAKDAARNLAEIFLALFRRQIRLDLVRAPTATAWTKKGQADKRSQNYDSTQMWSVRSVAGPRLTTVLKM